MLTAKNRVAPIRSVSLSRSEPYAALLGAKLVGAVCAVIHDERFPKPEIFARSDTTVTISWLKDCPKRWKVL